ncbi:MAG: hypothetical protein FD174_3219 [Geobacteraceae bacterium]|nr:MAG: hypothetical protein FD174_3219 [Geobacteraceae bacterium]
MSLFFLTFFLVYGGVHVYTFFKARQAVGFGIVQAIVLAVFLTVMVLAPVLVRLAEKEGYESTARMTAYTGYIWMGVLFLFFSAAVAIDLYRLLIFSAGKILHRDIAFLMLSDRSAFFIPLAWGIITSAYGYFEAREIRVERIVIKSPKIPREMGKLTIAQISDVHLGLIVREERLARILDKVKAAAPDILVSTGDLVDGQINRLTGLAELLREVKPRYGKFAVTGNHEFYAGLNQAVDFTERSGFKLLRGERADIAGIVTIAGIDDPARTWAYQPRRIQEKELLSRLPPERFTIFLKHRPAVEQGSLGLFDLQLSGHVHKGQIFPFNLVTYLFYPVKAGYSNYPHNSSLYVNRGSGTWGPPIRFLAPPEVTIIELVSSRT